MKLPLMKLNNLSGKDIYVNVLSISSIIESESDNDITIITLMCGSSYGVKHSLEFIADLILNIDINKDDDSKYEIPMDYC